VKNDGERELATLWKMEMQYYGKIICNFLQKVLAKNTVVFSQHYRYCWQAPVNWAFFFLLSSLYFDLIYALIH